MITEIKEYINQFPNEVQERLVQLHELILNQNDKIEEHFAYKMPAYKLNGKPLIYFAGYKHHIGLYAMPVAHEKFKEELSCYKQGKGSIQFPLVQPLPVDLIKRIIKFRVSELLSTT